MFQSLRAILLIYILCFNEAKSFFILDAFESLKSAVELGVAISEVRDEKDLVRIIYDSRSAEDMMEDLSNQIKQISTKLNRMESRLSNKVESVKHNIMKKLGLSQKLMEQFNVMFQRLFEIDNHYNNYLRYSSETEAYNNETILDFAYKITSHGDDSLIYTTKNIYRLLMPDIRNMRILRSVIAYFTEDLYLRYTETCGLNLSPQRRLYELFETIMIAEMKSYVATIFAYDIKSKFNNQSYVREKIDLSEDLNDRVNIYLSTIRAAMKYAPKDIRACDPEHYKSRETYIELEGLYTPYFINERETNNEIYFSNPLGIVIGNCINNCEYDRLPSDNRTKCSSTYCNDNRCQRSIVDCFMVPGNVEVCFSDSPYKRYEWFKYLNTEVTFGDTSIPCSNGKLRTLKSWFQYPAMYYCDMCQCTCENYGLTKNVINMISLMKQLANTSNNEVIIGIRFKLRGQIIAVEIKTGKLGADGIISNEKWNETPNFSNHKLVENVDYTFFDKFNLRSINLDDLLLPENYTLTGVTLVKDGSSLSMKIRGTKFDYSTGVLSSNVHVWIDPSQSSDPNYNRPRVHLKIPSPKNPLKSTMNLLNSVPNMYVNVTMTNLEDDAGNHIVPFFDAQDFAIDPGFPLAGLSLAHKGSTGYGGYIIWRLINFDVSPLLNRSYYWKPGNIVNDTHKLKTKQEYSPVLQKHPNRISHELRNSRIMHH